MHVASNATPSDAPVVRRTRRDRNVFTPRLWPRIFYRVNWFHGRWVGFASIRLKILRVELTDRAGGYILATTHLSHLEPFIASVAQRRKIDWMSRIEFFKYRIFALGLKWFDAFAVNRQGVPVSAIRTSIARLRQGRVIGICPEGGVAIGKFSSLRGGPIKQGAALLAQRTGAPIIPCVMIGAHTLNCVKPWIPFKRGRLWIAYGEPIFADLTATDRRSERRRVTEVLLQSYQSLYRELQERYGIADSYVP